MVKATVHVTLKPGVLDPAGRAILHSLATLGFDGVESVRQGKYFEIELSGDDREQARQSLDAMCAQLIANPIIENYKIEICG
jgi:phosphoribosylformylglycinamidine synthase